MVENVSFWCFGIIMAFICGWTIRGILTGQKKMSESQRRMAYIIEFGSDAMEYRRDDFDD